MRYIYLLKLDGFNTYKIGISKDPKKRVKQLQTGSPEIIEILCTYKSDWAFKIESTLHRRYLQNNIRGEWFEFNYLNKDIFLNECKKICTNLTYIKENATKIFL